MADPYRAFEQAANVGGYVEDGKQVDVLARNAWNKGNPLWKRLQRIGGLGLALGALEGASKSLSDAYQGTPRDDWFDSMGFDQGRMNPAQIGLADALRTFQDVGNATTYGGANWIGERLPPVDESLEALRQKFLSYAMKPGQRRASER